MEGGRSGLSTSKSMVGWDIRPYRGKKFKFSIIGTDGCPQPS